MITPSINVVNNVFLSLLHILDTILAKPKFPLDAVSSAIILPNKPHTSIRYASALMTSSSVATHSVIKFCLYKNKAPIIEPAIKKGSHFLVAIAPITIPITIITAIRP